MTGKENKEGGRRLDESLRGTDEVVLFLGPIDSSNVVDLWEVN
jgi:hypothetical protein